MQNEIFIQSVAKKLIALPALMGFAVGGDYALWLHLRHRPPQTLELYCNELIGGRRFSSIEKAVRNAFGEQFSNSSFSNLQDAQFTVFQFTLHGIVSTIHITLYQNVRLLDELEYIGEIPLLSVRDIGLLKLSCLPLKARWIDFYDLDRITDDIPLCILIRNLEIRSSIYNRLKDFCFYDLINSEGMLNNRSLLFPKILPDEHTEATDGFRKSIGEAYASWIKKVGAL
jgi:hypothetical protein